MKPLKECVLYTFIDAGYLNGRDPVEIARQLCEGGSDIIQLRAKDWPAAKIEAVAREVQPILRAHNAAFVINDHLQVAQKVEADFCHLGQEDFFDQGWKDVSELPKLSGNTSPQIGLSTHAPEQAQRSVEAGAGYIAIGPVYPTGTKPGARPVTLEYVRWAADNIQLPWFAIGGINLETVDSVLNAGATRICVVSAILNHENITAACGEFKVRLQSRN